MFRGHTPDRIGLGDHLGRDAKAQQGACMAFRGNHAGIGQGGLLGFGQVAPKANAAVALRDVDLGWGGGAADHNVLHVHVFFGAGEHQGVTRCALAGPTREHTGVGSAHAAAFAGPIGQIGKSGGHICRVQVLGGGEGEPGHGHGLPGGHGMKGQAGGLGHQSGIGIHIGLGYFQFDGGCVAGGARGNREGLLDAVKLHLQTEALLRSRANEVAIGAHIAAVTACAVQVGGGCADAKHFVLIGGGTDCNGSARTL